MFLRGLRESLSRKVHIHEQWSPSTFAAFLKSLYCFDFKKSLVPVQMFPVGAVELTEFLQMTEMYQQLNMKMECFQVIFLFKL